MVSCVCVILFVVGCVGAVGGGFYGVDGGADCFFIINTGWGDYRALQKGLEQLQRSLK